MVEKRRRHRPHLPNELRFVLRFAEVREMVHMGALTMCKTDPGKVGPLTPSGPSGPPLHAEGPTALT